MERRKVLRGPDEMESTTLSQESLVNLVEDELVVLVNEDPGSEPIGRGLGPGNEYLYGLATRVF